MRENSLEVETNYTCLAFWGRKARGGQDSSQKRLMQLMEALAELEEDERLDDGEVEIPSVLGSFREIKYNVNFC